MAFQKSSKTVIEVDQHPSSIFMKKTQMATARFSLIVFLILSFYSCRYQENDFQSFDDFPHTENLISIVYHVSEAVYLPMSLFLLKDRVVVVDQKSEYIFHLFDANKFSYEGGFVRHGRGPGEEEEYFNPYMRKVDESSIIYQTPSSIKTVSFSAEMDSLSITGEVNLFDNIINFQNLFKLGNRYLGYEGSLGHSTEFHGYDPVSSKMFEFGEGFPWLEKQIENEGLFLELKRVTVKPDESMFAAAYLCFPMVRIFCGNTGYVVHDTRFVCNKQIPQASLADNPKNKEADRNVIYYSIINSTDNYIYVLYGNNSFDMSNELHIFDWEGNPVKRIFLDKDIFTFDVSPDDSFIIACSHNHTDKLFKFNLTR